MEKLTLLISSLNSRETKAVRRFFRVTRMNTDSLKSRLFDILVKNKGISDTKASKLLKRNATDPSFTMLKRRLKDDIIKVLVWEGGAKTFTSKAHEAKYKCRLMIMEAELLITRGLPQLAEEILKKAFKLAKHYELTNESILVNELLQTQVGLKKGLTSYRYYADNNLENFDIIKERFIAQDYFRKLNMPNLFFANKELNYKEKSKEATSELRELSKRSKSVQVKFWYLRSEIYYNHLVANYKKAKVSAEEFIKLVKNSPIVYSKDNLGGANMQLAMIFIYLKSYPEAVKYANVSLGLFVKGSLNMLNALDCKYIASLYQSDFQTATDILKDVKEMNLYKSNPLMNAKWLYYEANLYFLMKKFDDALATLQQQTELTSDKSGWRLGYKILEMMCITELGYLDWLDYRIETFRKLLSDVRKENIARPKVIFQLLKSFIRTSYDFNEATSINTEHLALLDKAADEFAWDPRGYEIIRFEKWWNSKIKKRRAA
ncbi:MAG: hypothetical protein ACKVPJ_09710 [Chitinophagales bacterium]